MDHFGGLDISVKQTSICIVDDTGKIVKEVKVASEPAALLKVLGNPSYRFKRIGLEAGPLSQWLYAGMREAGLSVELLETRHVRDAFKAMPVKTDRKDARGIAQLMRLGWFRPVHCKSLPAQETRALLTARKLVQSKRHDLEMSVRGILRGFGPGSRTGGRSSDVADGDGGLADRTGGVGRAAAAFGEAGAVSGSR